MTQADRLLDYLRHHHGIDPMMAWKELGIYRLASRICDLKAQGYTIRKETRNILNRYGEACGVAYYMLESEPAPAVPAHEFKPVSDRVEQGVLL